MSGNQVAVRYAKSLLELSTELNKTQEVKADILTLKEALKSRDFYLLLKSPVIYASAKNKAIKAVLGNNLDKLTLDFITLLVKKGRESFLPEVIEAFDSQFNKAHHIAAVRVRSAFALDEATRAVIMSKVKDFVGQDMAVQIESSIDPSLLGGFVIEYEDNLYDSSVVYQLEKLKKSFSNN
ncbi:MAG TPA: ATP synthase F1 subunit delta [Saprospiraceae bacterium]|nr:ATP synthase F1 subunit delta [Saprospiraceae bacterium]HQW56880.1 ATP synthase F1 subunit delta [Saprospiraceae bacterium]